MKRRIGVSSEWADIPRTIRNWLVSRLKTDTGIHGAWFFSGGSWVHSHNPRIQVRTAAAEISDAVHIPNYWSVSYQHPDSQIGARQWKTDIGLTAQGPESFRAVITTTNWLLPGYIGDEPLSPVPTSPKIVGDLMALAGWDAWCGTEAMTPQPKPLLVGHAHEFFARLTDTGRECPIVLISREHGSEDFKVVPGFLSGLLKGMASVYFVETSEIDDEMTIFLPQEFRCANGMVRVYQPHLEVDVEGNFRRHRFFSRRYIIEQGVDHTQSVIVRGIAHRPLPAIKGAVASVEDVQAKASEQHFESLRRQATTAASKDEKIGFYEELTKELESKRKDHEVQLNGLNSRVDSLEGEIQERDDKISWLEYQKNEMERQSQAAERTSAGLQKALAGLKALPDSILKAVELIEQIHSDRVIFTQQARKTAEESEFSDLDLAWQCLWAAATVLPALFFAETKQKDLGQEFKRLTRFELAMSESSKTKEDPKLMRLRRDVWQGQGIDISPHVKCDKGGDFLRIHFYVCQKEKLIVIGRCGDHMETAGTRRQR